MTPPILPSVAQALIEERLRSIVSNADTDDFLIVVGHQEKNYFVQFILDEHGGLHCEAAGNAVISDLHVLNAEQITALSNLGWKAAPSDVNFYIELPPDSPSQLAKRGAELAVRTLLGPYALNADAPWLLEDASSDRQEDIGDRGQSSPLLELSEAEALQWIERQVAKCLREIPDETYIGIIGDANRGYEVSLAFGDRPFVYCQAASNEVLDPKYAIDLNQEQAMLGLGWNNDHQVKFWQRLPIGELENVPQRCCELVLNTLRKVFGIPANQLWTLDDGTDPAPRAMAKQPINGLSSTPVEADDGWDITPPDSGLHLTLRGTDAAGAQAIAKLLHSQEYHRSESRIELLTLFMEQRLSCPQIDAVVTGYRTVFREVLSALRSDDHAAPDTDSTLAALQVRSVLDTLGLNSSFAVFFEHDTRPHWRSDNPSFNHVPLPVLRYYLIHYHHKWEKLVNETSRSSNPLVHECARYGLIHVGINVPLQLLAEQFKVQDINRVLGTKFTRRSNAVEALLASPSEDNIRAISGDLTRFSTAAVRFTQAQADLFFADWSWTANLVSLMFYAVHPDLVTPSWWAQAGSVTFEPRAPLPKLKVRALRHYQTLIADYKTRTAWRSSKQGIATG